MCDECEALADRVADLEQWREAMSRKYAYQQEQLDELRDENDRLREKLATLDEIVDPNPEARDYASLDRDQKVFILRRHLVEEAARKSGKAALHYRDVKWLFDSQPSAGHCYDLMALAGELDGFAYDTPGGDGGQKRIRVNLDGVNDETLLHAANNADTEEAA